MPSSATPQRNAVKGLVLAYLWINASEIFRYFVFVMPMMRAALPQFPEVAPMSLSIFLIWGLWSAILFAVSAVIIWLYFERFGYGFRNAIIAGTLDWITIFCIFWLAAWNMNLAPARIPLVALPLAWLEQVVTALIIDWTLSRKDALDRAMLKDHPSAAAAAAGGG